MSGRRFGFDRLAASFAVAAVAVTWSGAPRAYAAAAANDAFADAAPVVLFETVTGSTVDATCEVGEPMCLSAEYGASGSIWYRFDAPVSGPIAAVTTQGRGYTRVGVYTGSAVDELALVAYSDDAPGFSRSERSSLGQAMATFVASQGETYWVQISEGFTPPGTIKLRMTVGARAGRPVAEAGVAADAERVEARGSVVEYYADTEIGDDRGIATGERNTSLCYDSSFGDFERCYVDF